MKKIKKIQFDYDSSNTWQFNSHVHKRLFVSSTVIRYREESADKNVCYEDPMTNELFEKIAYFGNNNSSANEGIELTFVTAPALKNRINGNRLDIMDLRLSLHLLITYEDNSKFTIDLTKVYFERKALLYSFRDFFKTLDFFKKHPDILGE